ncbi:MAG: WD40 repeat domain-containing protein [Promethearchaeota archaeon]|jgi:WD40 repeat protein
MKSKRLKVSHLPLLVIILLGHNFFIIESSAFSYSNPSTTPLWSYPTGNQFVSGVAISSDGSYITAACRNLVSDITMHENGKLFVFDNSISTTKKPLWNYSIVNDFYSLAISGDASHILAGGGNFERTVYHFNNSKPTPEWAYYTNGWVYDIEISNDGYYAAATSGQNQTVFLFNTSESLPIKEYSTTGVTLRVVLSSNGSYMAVTDNAAKLYFFNTSNSSPDWTFTSGDGGSALAISADGNYIALGQKNVYFFRKHSSIPLWAFNTSGSISSIKISQNGNYIVAGGTRFDDKIYLFNRNHSIPVWTYSTGEEITSVDISYNGDYIVAQGRHHNIYLFNKSSSIPIWRYRLDGPPTSNQDYGLEISSDGKYIVVGGRQRIYLFDRDIIQAPKLIIPGYNLFIMFLIIGVITLPSSIALFRHLIKIQRKITKQLNNLKK